MRMRWFAALAAVFALGGVAAAQPAKAEPTVEVRLRSVNDLVGKAEYVAGLAGQEEAVKQVRQLIKTLSADGKGLEGIDTRRPFGLYATLTPDVVTSPFTVMLPIADRDRFLDMLKTRLDLTPEKADDGTYKIPAPVINEAHLRFANGYCYVGRSAKDLDPKTLPDPKAFFAKDDGAVASVIVRFEQIPADVKTFIIGQFELAVAEQRRKNGANQSPAEKAVMDWVGDNLASGLKSLLEDSKELRARVLIDEKTDDLAAELTLTAKSGTVLSKNISGLAGRTSIPAAIVGGGPNSVARVTAKVGLPDGVKKDLDKVVDDAFAEILKKFDDNPLIAQGLKVVGPTLKAGELDFALAVNGPDAQGRHTLIAAAGVKGGKDIEKLVKDLVKQFGFALGDKIKFAFDVEKVGAFSLHTVTVSDVPAEIEKVFGTNKVWVAVSDDYIAFSVEPDGTALRAGLKAKPLPVPALSAEVAFAKLVPLVAPNLKPDELKAMMKDAFGDGPTTGKDTLSLTVTGGDKFTVKGNLKGKGVRLLTTLDQFKNK